MSADNWTDCPKCRAKAFGSLSNREQKHSESYGKIDAKKWVENQRGIEAEWDELNSGKHFQTFRENYQIGVDCDGTFSVTYRGLCTKCGAEYKFENEIPGAVSHK